MATTDVLIIGGGLAGLTASAILAKAGKQVVLLEKAATLGGRSRTQHQSDFCLNLGPHALYQQGIAARTYRELGLQIVGGEPKVAQGSVYSRDTLQPIPFSPLTLLRSSLFTWTEKWETIRSLQRLTSLNPIEQRGRTMAEWLAVNVRGESVKAFFQAVLRLATYCADLELLDAGLAIEQFQLSLGGVLYLDRGWQTLVDGLVGISQQFGAKLLTAQQISKVKISGSFPTVELADGNTITAAHVILATDPTTVQQLLGVEFPTIPIRAACLDLALRRLPQPDRTFAIGLDRPFYYSVHSAYSKLAPESGAVVHVARYLRHDDDLPATELRSQLEAFLDRLQPGWQQEVIHARFMPNLAVAQDLPGKKSIEIEMPNIHLAGDWVGDKGMLSDRAVASAIAATQRILHAL
ncbi:phytoene desaturase family protein [Chamaesiphon polymorphus]|nr:FAD-dependent oxidoreductase [Chamaesiphon polymorphus]